MLWNEKFNLGIQVIDDQHKELFRLMDLIQDLMTDAKDGIDCFDELESVLLELERYTRYHFEEEEKLMESVGYAKLDRHREEHTAFIEKVQNTLDSDLDFQQVEVIEEIHEFLLTWVSDHILETDVYYVEDLKKRLLR